MAQSEVPRTGAIVAKFSQQDFHSSSTYRRFGRTPRGRLRLLFLLGFLGLALRLNTSPVRAQEASRLEALERRMLDLERAVAELRSEGKEDPSRLQEIERQIQILAKEIETLKLSESTPEAAASVSGLGPGASKIYSVKRGVSLGGYGEMLYENFDRAREDGTSSPGRDKLDFLRAVVYLGYKFNDRVLFNSEIEFEHATTGEGAEERGEVSLEFAYLDFFLKDKFNVRAGMVLVPMGFVNEQHEPPTFLGARRPYVERNLLPSTWRENGAGFFGESGPVSYRAYLVTGLAAVQGTSSEAEGFSASGIRGGRSSGSNSAAEDLALTGRLDWKASPSISVGGSFYSGGAGQGKTTMGGEAIDARTTLFDVHAECRFRGLEARALFVRTSIADATKVNDAQGLIGNQSVGERQYGAYGQVGYDVLAPREGTRQALIPFLRYERYNTQDRVPAGFSADLATDVTVTTLGVSWKPILNVAVKADYSRIENEARTGVDQFNLALGFLY